MWIQVHIQLYRSQLGFGLNGAADVKFRWRAQADTWYFLAMAYVSGEYAKLYVDGQLIETKQMNRPQNMTFEGAALGAWQRVGSDGMTTTFSRFGNLELSAFRWYSTEKDGVDGCPTGEEEDLLLMYDFASKGCGKIVKDVSANGRDATVVGASWNALAKDDVGGSCDEEAPTPKPCMEPNIFSFDGVRLARRPTAGWRGYPAVRQDRGS